MKYLYSPKNTEERNNGKIKIKIYNTKSDNPKVSFSELACEGRHGKTKNSINDRIYYIVSGKGSFEIEDKEYKVEAGDVMMIPKSTIYDFSGNMKLFLIHQPAFEREAETKVLDDKDDLPDLDFLTKGFRGL